MLRRMNNCCLKGVASMYAAGSALSELAAAVPKGKAELDNEDIKILSKLTRQLVAERAGAPAEYQRFLEISRRTIALPEPETRAWLQGRTVLITGGTGCIGSILAGQVLGLGPKRLVCLSRGETEPRCPVPGTEYLHGDIRDRAALSRLFDEVRPDVVFHLAAQRQPGLAETEVHRTLTTNVFGTRNVLAAAAEFDVPDTVVTSTGKALRPYSPDVYAASKRVAEWIAARAAARPGRRKISAVRFTHVADNSIIAGRLRRWCESGVIRLHGAEIEFYVQSGAEAAQLLIAGGLGASDTVLRINALRDLDWPVSLLDLTLGMIAESGSESPIYIAGYEDGYEQSPFPALYDPATAGDVSPLINAFEAPATGPSLCGQVDSFDAPAPGDDAEALARLELLEEACGRTADPEVLRPVFEEVCLALLDATIRDLPKPALNRALRFTARSATPIDPAHNPLIDALRRWADD
jgi:NAD(P)-dependent dehydrogenase (short-subunit alcohol dehydrogenase family)